jgi:putative redox protein
MDMDAKVIWNGNMSFTGSTGSELSLPIDTSLEHGGMGPGFSPMALVLVGLAGCTGMDVIDILRKKRQDVTAFEVKVHGDRVEEHPKVYNHIVVEYVVTGHAVDPAAVERAVDLSVTKYCSVQAMLSKTAEVEHRITLLEAA